MRYLPIGSVGVLLTTFLSTALPTSAFTIALDPTLCGNPSDCTTTDYKGSTAALDLKFSNTSKGVNLELAIANKTSMNVGSTLVGVAFDLPDFVKSFTYDRGNSAYAQLYRDAALPPFAGTFDIGIRAYDRQPPANPEDSTFAGGNPVAGLMPGETTTVSLTLEAGERDARALEEYMYQAYLKQNLKAAGRFEQVGPQGQGKDRVLGIVKFVQPPKEVPEPGVLFGLGAMALAMTLRASRTSSIDPVASDSRLTGETSRKN